MREIMAESQPFVRDELPADKAREVFAGHRFKLEIIDDASTDPMSATSASESVRTYENPPTQPKDAAAVQRLPGLHRPVPRPARARPPASTSATSS